MGKVWAIGTLVMLAIGGIAIAFSGSSRLNFSAGEWAFSIGICLFFCWIVGGFIVDLWKDDNG